MPGTILKTKLLSLGASAYLGAYAIAAPFSTAQAWCLAWHSDLSDKICFLQRDYNRRDKRDAACSNRPNQPSLIAIFWPFLANFLPCTKIFHKTEVQTGILRCWRGLNLNWFKKLWHKTSYYLPSTNFLFTAAGEWATTLKEEDPHFVLIQIVWINSYFI